MSSNFLPPVVIVGSERSGTNLLRAVLSTHSKIASPPPAGFIDALGGYQQRYCSSGHRPRSKELIDDVIALTRIHLNPWDIDLDPAAIRSRVDGASLWEVFRVVNEIYAEAHGRPCWCSKESGLFRHISEIAKRLPDAKFVYLVRDGRDVALSLLRGHLHEFHVYFAANYWALSQRLCLSALAEPAHSGRMHLLKYEDLIGNPEGEVQRMMQFIGLGFEKRQLQFYQDERVVHHSKRSRFWKNLAHPIDGTNKGMYRDKLGVRNIEIFESVAWEEMEALGYPLDSDHKRTFSDFDIRLYRTIAFLRRKLWSMDPSTEGSRIRARVKATRQIINRLAI